MSTASANVQKRHLVLSTVIVFRCFRAFGGSGSGFECMDLRADAGARIMHAVHMQCKVFSMALEPEPDTSQPKNEICKRLHKAPRRDPIPERQKGDWLKNT